MAPTSAHHVMIASDLAAPLSSPLVSRIEFSSVSRPSAIFLVAIARVRLSLRATSPAKALNESGDSELARMVAQHHQVKQGTGDVSVAVPYAGPFSQQMPPVMRILGLAEEFIIWPHMALNVHCSNLHELWYI
jgi:hypothetical protein